MDDFTFNLVSLFAAAGGAVGTFVGYNKLKDIRKIEKEVTTKPSDVSITDSTIAIRDNRRELFAFSKDFTRTMGFLGMYSVYGMVVYPWMPLYAIGNVFRHDGMFRGAFNRNNLGIFGIKRD